MNHHQGSREVLPVVLPPSAHFSWDREIQSLGLSEQQSRIVALILQSKQDKEIAVALGLSTHTIRTYLGRIFMKLEVTDRVGLVLRVVGAPRSQGSEDVCN